MKRGELYYINMENSCGHELKKDRPGIIIGVNPVYRTTVTVVLCTGSYRAEAPSHIIIRSTPRVSTAMCEHIYTIDIARLKERIGELSPQELAAVEIGVASALGLDFSPREVRHE